MLLRKGEAADSFDEVGDWESRSAFVSESACRSASRDKGPCPGRQDNIQVVNPAEKKIS